jgi:hypothetical protein
MKRNSKEIWPIVLKDPKLMTNKSVWSMDYFQMIWPENFEKLRLLSKIRGWLKNWVSEIFSV